MFTELLPFLLISLGINIAMFIPAYLLKTDKLTDISYSVSFFVLAAYAVIRQGSDAIIWDYILLSIITIWGIRLGGYLLYRVLKLGKDTRFNGLRESFVGFGLFWLMQGFSVWVISIPSILFITSTSTSINMILAVIGIWIWSEGFFTETIADYQKFKYIENRKNKDLDRHWVDEGLWGYIRHPNYLGEIIVWSGIYVMTLSRLDFNAALVSLISPIYIFLIIRYFSGVNFLEKKNDRRWGSDEEYVAYKEKTGIFLPKF